MNQNTSLQARAEMGLLEALHQERKPTATKKIIGKFEVPPKESMLKARKAHEKQQKLRFTEQDRDAVASLHHQPIDPSMRHKTFPKLARKRMLKRTTHDATVKQFEVRCGTCSTPSQAYHLSEPLPIVVMIVFVLYCEN